MQANLKLKRKLGFWEYTCKYGHDYFAGTGNVSSCIEFHANFDIDDLKPTLQKLFMQHPLLRSTIKEHRHEAFLEETAEFNDIPIQVHHVPQLNLQDWLSQSLQQTFASESYLWRVNFYTSPALQQHVLIATFHHSICDGLSAIHFVLDWLSCIENKNLTLASLPGLEHVESYLPQSVSWSDMINYKKKLRLQNSYKFPYNQFVKPKERKTECIIKRISATSFEYLKSTAKKHGVTIQGLLNAILLKTIANIEPKLAHEQIALHTPINLRPYCSPEISMKHFGCFISMVTTCQLPITTMNLWNAAKLYKENLELTRNEMGYCPKQFYIGDFDIETLNDLFEMPGSTKRSHFSGGFGISNLGSIDVNNFKTPIKNLLFCTHRAMGDYVIFINTLSFENELQLVFCYCKDLLAEEWAHSFISEFIAIMEKKTFHNSAECLA